MDPINVKAPVKSFRGITLIQLMKLSVFSSEIGNTFHFEAYFACYSFFVVVVVFFF